MTDAKLGNLTVGVDIGVTEVNGNIRTHNYGNIWVNVSQAVAKPPHTYGCPLNKPVAPCLRASGRIPVLIAIVLLLVLAWCIA